VGVLQGRAQFDSDPGAPLQRAWLSEGEQAGFVWDESARMERLPPSQDSFSAWFINRDLAESGLAPQQSEAYYGTPEMVRPEEPQRYENRGTTIVEYGRVWIPAPVVRRWEPHRSEALPLPRQYPQPQPQTPPPPPTPATPRPTGADSDPRWRLEPVRATPTPQHACAPLDIHSRRSYRPGANSTRKAQGWKSSRRGSAQQPTP
jgi:hypothetical protein